MTGQIDTLNDDLETFYGNGGSLSPMYVYHNKCGSKRSPHTTITKCQRSRWHTGDCRGFGKTGKLYTWPTPERTWQE